MALQGSLSGHGLTVVWPGNTPSEPGRGSPPEADIVFVHGLNGDRVRTWTTKGGVFWPKDLLPQKLGTCRSMVFGYNADLGFTSSSLDIRDFAVSLLSGLRDHRQEIDELGRPLIFVCHSLGGIVAKKALLVARIGDTYSDISKSIVGLVFFGTPHRGSTVADFGAVLNSVARFLDRRDLLSSLSRDNQALLDISQDFIALVGSAGYSIKSFYEENKTAGIRLIVTRDSATMNITQEEALPIEGDHREMCRFEKVDDARFQAVWNAIRRLIPKKETIVLSVADEKLLNSIPGVDVGECLQQVNAPYGHSCDWVAKHDLLVSLQTSRSLHVLHIVGKPGSGKSTLAGHLYRSHFNSGLGQPVFYFSFAENNRHTAASAWGCLLRQFLEYDPRRIPEVRSRSRPTQVHTWSEYRLQNEFEILAKRVASATSLYIIDAIDECDSTVDKFLGSVESILNGCEQKTVKFLFLGRRQDSLITLRLRPLIAEGLATLELDKEAFQLDGVKIYVDQKVEELCLRRPGLRLRKDYLVKLLCDKSDGMYLLTELAIASLRSASGYDADVMAELEKIPPKIGFIYRKALDGVEAKHRITVSNLLLWMTFGLRRLTEQEMSFVLASVADSSFLKRYLDNGLQHAYFDVVGDGGVQAIVGTLVKVTETSVGPMILDLVHGTARQYLATIEQREQDTDSSVPDWFVDSIYGHLNVARFRRDSLPRPSSDLHSFAHEAIYRQCYACLDETIAHDRLRITKTSDDDRINSVLPFFSYAAENIFEHARHVSTKNTAFYLEMAANLDSRRGRMIRDHFWHSKAPEEHKDQPLIHFACELGLEGLVACLIPRTDPKCRDSTWNTPLNIAAATGIIPILKLLCESGKFRPNEHEKGPGGGTALHTAVYYGHLEATQYLMSKVTDDGVYHGYHPGTRHPLEKIYDTLQGRIDPPRPADVAAQIDNVPMLKLFQNYGCLDSRTFFEAVASGSTRTMDYLAQLPSVDLSWKNSALCKSAHVGAKSGRLSSMEWLEAHQCMTKDFESDGFQLIHLAGLRGHHRIVDVLVRRGHAGIDDPDKQGFTVLRLACREGVYETIAVAIQYGAKTRWGLASSETISALDEVLDRLHNAPERLSKTAWVLLDLVPDLRDGRWVLNTPTHMAKYAHYRVLEHLLKRRAENFRNKAPPAAPSHQDQFATRLFDVFFGSIHAVDSQGRTALHNLLIGWVSLDLGPYSETDWIASVGHLLDHGADIDIMDRYGMTALDVYIYTLTGLRDATGYPVPPDLQFSPPKFICDGVLRTLSTRPDGFPRTLFTELPQVRTVSSLLTKHRGELLLSLGRQQRKYPEDAKVLLSCFPKDELDVWMERYATADVIFLLRSAGRPDKESVPVLEKLPSKELVAILLKDFFAQGDYERLLPLSPLCQGALRRLREVDTSAIGPALAAARSKLGSSDSAQDNAALKHMQTHCLPDEIPEGFENSLLLKAVQAGDTDGVRYLVETCSADVDAALDDRRRPALSIAASYVHVPVVKYLLEHGATVQKRDNTGATALHWAARGYSEDNKDIFRLLLDHGAQITDELLADSKTNWNMSQFLRQLRETPSRPT